MLLGLVRGGYSLLHMAPIHGDWPDWSGQRAMSEMEQVGSSLLPGLSRKEEEAQGPKGAVRPRPAGAR